MLIVWGSFKRGLGKKEGLVFDTPMHTMNSFHATGLFLYYLKNRKPGVY